MPFNGSGVFAPPGSDFPAVAGTLIEAAKFNAIINDISTNGLSNCITKDGQTTVTANIPMGGFKFTGLAVGSAAADSARFSQIPVVATQAQQEAGSSAAVFVAPSVQQYHPSAVKAWCNYDYSSGTPSIEASYNVTSLTDSGTGNVTYNLTVAFSAQGAGVCTVTGGTGGGFLGVFLQGTTSVQTVVYNDSFIAVDTGATMMATGDQ